MIRAALLALLVATAPAAQPVADALPRLEGVGLGFAADTLDGRRDRAEVDGGARTPDEWIARDKALHFGGSFLLTLSGQYVLVDKAEMTNRDALPLSIGTALALGLAKEVMDSRRTRDPHFCWRDLAADAAGVALAAGLIGL